MNSSRATDIRFYLADHMRVSNAFDRRPKGNKSFVCVRLIFHSVARPRIGRHVA